MRYKKWAKTTLKKIAILCIDLGLVSLFWAHLVVTVAVAQAQTFHQSRMDSTVEKSNSLKLGNVFVATGNVDKQQASLIFYKVKSPHYKGAITVYVNGMYHTTLASNAFSALCVSPGLVNLMIKPVMVGGHVIDDESRFSVIEIQGGRHHYARVSEAKGVQALQMVSEQVALTELVTAKDQIHTLSRVTPVQVCRSAPAQSVTQSVP